MPRWGALVLLASVALGLGACGGGEGTTGSGSGSGSGSGTASASGVGACEPVGNGGGTEVGVTLDEWKVVASPASVAAGKVTFDVRNEGEEPHELVVVRAKSASELKVVDGKVDEDALPAGALVGEVEAFPAGQSCEGTFELSAGSYVLFCNIVETHEGKPESHVQEGMVTTFEVR